MNSALFDPTEEQLRAAWEQRRRYGWPHTFEESMENPILHRIIKMHAKHGMGSGERRIERVGEGEALEPSRGKLLELPPYDPSQDRKRAAAGDKDD